MPTTLELEEHLVALTAAAERLGELAATAGLSAAVPTCPAWDVRALVAHQAMVHRWATAHVRGDDREGVPNQTEIRASVQDLPPYYADGHRALVAALREAPDDLVALRFLNDAPPPRQFWARRQTHETTIHMVDALAAVLGRVPTAAETSIDHAVAEDGIDELLRGFFTRGASKLFDGTEMTVLVAPTDTTRSWLLHVAERLTVDPDVDGDDGGDGGKHRPADGADVVLRGTTVATYVGLWNRGDELEQIGGNDTLERWRRHQRVTWS